jgi:biopolymer transport protein ExbD
MQTPMRLEERVQRHRQARRNPHLFANIELSGLLAICIVLLVFSMTLPQPHHSYGPDFDVTNHSLSLPNANKEDAIVVAVMRDGAVYFRNSKTTCELLPDAIRQAVRDGAERKVYVKADARARYVDVEAVIDAIRHAGIANVAFITVKPTK